MNKVTKLIPIVSIGLLVGAVGLQGQILPAPIFLDMGDTAPAAGTTETGPAGITGTWQQVTASSIGAANVLTLAGGQSLEMSRGNSNAAERFTGWTLGLPSQAWTNTPAPAGSAIREADQSIFGDVLRSGDAYRTLGMRISNLAPGQYEIYLSLRPGIAEAGRNVGVGVISSADMGTTTGIADLSQETVASWADFNVGLASWTANGAAGDAWNYLFATVTVESWTDYIVAIVEGTNNGLMGITAAQIVAIPEPSTYAALFGLFALGFVAWRRRVRG